MIINELEAFVIRFFLVKTSLIVLNGDEFEHVKQIGHEFVQ